MIVLDTIWDYHRLAVELFSASLSSEDNQVGVDVPGTTYIAGFEIKEVGEETYSFRDFLVDTQDGPNIIAMDENTSGDEYSEEDVILLISNRLANLDLDKD